MLNVIASELSILSSSVRLMSMRSSAPSGHPLHPHMTRVDTGVIALFLTPWTSVPQCYLLVLSRKQTRGRDTPVSAKSP